MQRLFDKGVSRQNILYLNFFDDRLHNLQHEGLNNMLEAFFSLYPEKQNAERIYLSEIVGTQSTQSNRVGLS